MNASPFSQGSGGSGKSSSYPIWNDRNKSGNHDQPQIDSESTAFYTLDASGLITFYSKLAAEIWGRTPDFGDTYENFVTPFIQYWENGRFLPRGQSPMNDVLAGKLSGVYDAVVHIKRPDGSYVVVIVNIAPLIDDKGKIIGAAKSFCEHPLRKRKT